MKTDELIKSKKLCCGCGACVDICTKKAIEFYTDNRGFDFPAINSDLCIGCGQCYKICPIKNTSNYHSAIHSYAAISKDTNLLERSSSGGFFSSIAKRMIENGWCVSGAVTDFLNGVCYTHHIICDNLSELEKIQGSKYVQSDTEGIFGEIKVALKEGKKILFSGTPCQVDALYHYLHGNNIENLFTIDIICHGVPGNEVLNKYLKVLEKNISGTISGIQFRDKELSGWGLKGTVEFCRKGKKRKSLLIPKLSSYYSFFLDGTIYRDSCYECKYANEHRISDITIGDYWGIEEEHPELCKSWGGDKGVSCVIVNTNKGYELLKKYGEYIDYRETSIEKIARHNGQLVHSSKKTEETAKVQKMVEDSGYKAADEYFLNSKRYKRFVVLWYRMPFYLQVILTRMVDKIKKR